MSTTKYSRIGVHSRRFPQAPCALDAPQAPCDDAPDNHVTFGTAAGMTSRRSPACRLRRKDNSMTIQEALTRVTPQRFARVETQDGTSAIVPLCSNPECNIPITDFNLGKWCTLEPDETWTKPEIRAFCRSARCDIFHQIARESGHELISLWYELDQLWHSDQRHRFERPPTKGRRA